MDDQRSGNSKPEDRRKVERSSRGEADHRRRTDDHRNLKNQKRESNDRSERRDRRDRERKLVSNQDYGSTERSREL